MKDYIIVVGRVENVIDASLIYYIYNGLNFSLQFSTKISNIGTNIARIAKAALHKLPGKSILNEISVCPVSHL